MPEVIVDFSEHTVCSGDSFLFCSDGLYEHLSATTMCALLGAHEGGLNTACLQLIAAANAQGGRDNMSVVLVRAEKSKTSFFQARWRRIAPLFWRIRKTAFSWFEK
jgi:protein phosphatase